MQSELKIGKYQIGSRVIAAPMSGLTDLPFRRVLQKFGPGLVVSEMVASETFLRGDADTQARSAGKGEINPLVIQLIGREPEWMYEGAKLAEAAGADILDINMGCPARKVTSGLSGSALMRDLSRASAIIDAVLAATTLSVTLKMRLGWDDDSLNAPELALIAERAGIKMIAVHGRTRCQFYNGKVDWSAVKATKQAVSLPVIVNGDIDTPDDAEKALEQSGCDGVMLGRSLIGKPWDILAIRSRLDGGSFKPLSLSEKLDIITAHYQDMLDFYGQKRGVRIARKHVAAYIDHAPLELAETDKNALKSRLCRSVEPDEVLSGLSAAFNARQRGAA